MTGEIETVAIVGAGAMGGMYARHFADAGFPVVVAARGDRARRLARDGLVVNGTPVDVTILDADRPSHDITADLVVVAVKHHQLDRALDDVAPVVGPGTTFLSVLNGLDSERIIADRFGPAGVLLCIALGMDALREGGRSSFRQAGRLVFGEADNTVPSDRVRAVRRALDRAGLDWSTPIDMRHETWWKFMVNVGINQASGILRAPYGAFQVPGDARDLMESLIDEVVEVAAAEGVRLDETDRERWGEVLAGQPVDGKTSMHQDVEAGRPTEVEVFAGRVVALGDHHSIATPVNRTVLRILRAGHRGPARKAPPISSADPVG